MKRITVVILLGLLFTCRPISTFSAENADHVMKIAIGNPATSNNFGWTPFEILKTEIENRSNGRLKVELFAETLGLSSLEMIDMVRSNIVQARDFADGHFATIYPPIQILSIPYLFAERDIAWHVLDGPLGAKLIEDMAARTGLRPLRWFENGGFRHYSNNKRPIHSPADMKGLKIRTMESPLHIKIVSDLGASGIPIGWPNVYEAIESGIVDGQENSISTFLIPHFENIQKYVVLDGHIYANYTLLINEAWYQSLPDDLKLVLKQASESALVVNRGLAILNEQEGLAYLQSKGVEVYKPTNEEYVQFRQRTRQSAIDWLKQNVGEQWVKEVLSATAAAEKELGYNF